MNILAIDTSTKACVLGLQTRLGCFFDETLLDRSHSEEILPRIANLLAAGSVTKSQLDLLVFGQGPGSFTGLRIGVGVVQGLAFGLGIPVVGVSSLACLAQQAYRQNGTEHCLAMLLARQEEVYFGAYRVQTGIATLAGQELVCHALELPQQQASWTWHGAGNGWHLKSLVEQGTGVQVASVLEVEYPRAEDLLLLGQRAWQQHGGLAAAEARPRYLRETVASKPSSKPARK